MNSKPSFPLSSDPDAWELSVVVRRPRDQARRSAPGAKSI